MRCRPGRLRPIAWKGSSANFALHPFSEVRAQEPGLYLHRACRHRAQLFTTLRPESGMPPSSKRARVSLAATRAQFGSSQSRVASRCAARLVATRDPRWASHPIACAGKSQRRGRGSGRDIPASLVIRSLLAARMGIEDRHGNAGRRVLAGGGISEGERKSNAEPVWALAPPGGARCAPS